VFNQRKEFIEHAKIIDGARLIGEYAFNHGFEFFDRTCFIDCVALNHCHEFFDHTGLIGGRGLSDLVSFNSRQK
jgi:hypothetical protein